MLIVSQFLIPKKTQPTRIEFEVAPIAADNLSSDQSEKNKAKKIKLNNQIVDQSEQALNDEVPDDARFLSRNNQVVKKQTVAQEHGEFQNKQSSQPKGQANGKPDFKNLNLKPNFDVAKAIEERTQKEAAFEKAAQDGTLPMQVKAAEKKSEQLAAGGAQKGGETSQTLDYIKDLDTGLETLLSTKEFVYYSYFNRIRNQLNQHWSELVREKVSEIYKKGRNIASTDDKITKCLITLDLKGNLLKVQIIGDSGVRELDEAAVQAFKSAAPFPNPPKGMKDDDGNIKIRWDFILEA